MGLQGMAPRRRLQMRVGRPLTIQRHAISRPVWTAIPAQKTSAIGSWGASFSPMRMHAMTGMRARWTIDVASALAAVSWLIVMMVSLAPRTIVTQLWDVCMWMSLFAPRPVGISYARKGRVVSGVLWIAAYAMCPPPAANPARLRAAARIPSSRPACARLIAAAVACPGLKPASIM